MGYKETINDLQTTYDNLCDVNNKLQHDYDQMCDNQRDEEIANHKYKQLEIKYKDLQNQNEETLNALNLQKESHEKQMEQEMKDKEMIHQKYKELKIKYQTLLNEQDETENENDIDMND